VIKTEVKEKNGPANEPSAGYIPSVICDDRSALKGRRFISRKCAVQHLEGEFNVIYLVKIKYEY